MKILLLSFLLAVTLPITLPHAGQAQEAGLPNSLRFNTVICGWESPRGPVGDVPRQIKADGTCRETCDATIGPLVANR